VSVGSLGFGLYWHIERPFPLRFFHGHISDVNTIKWHSDINFLATGSDDKTVRLWDIRIKKSIGKISFDAPVNSVEFSHDGKDLTIAGKSRFIDTIDIRTLKSRFKIREEALKIDKICYLDEREFAYVKDSESVKIWGEYGKRRENYFKTNNFTNFKSVKVISDIHRIMQLKTDKLNKMTIVGLNL
jgi:WD40 repeat protein